MSKTIMSLIILLASGFIVLRVVYPVLHTETGYVLHGVPFFESEVCESRACSIDRSRTFLEIFAVAAVTASALAARRKS